MPVISICLSVFACCSFLKCVFLVGWRYSLPPSILPLQKPFLPCAQSIFQSLFFNLFFFHKLKQLSSLLWSLPSLISRLQIMSGITSRAGVLIATAVGGETTSACLSCTQDLISTVFPLTLQLRKLWISVSSTVPCRSFSLTCRSGCPLCS